ncbi:G-type lectin S-receptor-like serine/threonine-protein kinase RLK1 isoform X3 [Quercus robur]|uniref:G-type lectin S-receptor-like serine/threonine-protein kinase RLK1 isoform X3 n=1 Tax=Quercus robur TaxID=38942 RepID=UPI002163E947|nr:G-type lectin S-receptor-like serine/threonine-protein kinase RLK1 isoform X3 [Quercus robur]
MNPIHSDSIMVFALPHLLVLLLILLPISSIAQNNGSVTVGNSLTATDNTTSWLSPSGEFAFGFRPLNQTDLFLLSIWFDKIPDKTVVWYARVDNPVPRGSNVKLDADNGLVLTGPQGDELWTANTIVGTVAYGVMSNTGNFVLQDSSFNNLWESFKNPTDTLLPSQIVERSAGVVLYSRQSETNFSKGRFLLKLQDDGDLVLNTINLPTDNANDPYYNSETVASVNDSGTAGKQLVFNNSGYIYILRENNQTFRLSQVKPDSTADFYFRATINFDGVFTQYSYPKTSNANGSWTSLWSIPENICRATVSNSGSGTCGYNSICTLKSDRRPKCDCPMGYSLLDPNDQYGSCQPVFIQGCQEDKQDPGKNLYYFEVLINTDWPNADYAFLKPYTENQCKQSCMEDCMCAVAIFRLGDSCWKKKLPLSNGRVDSSINGGKVFIKIRNGSSIPPLGPHFPNNPESRKKNQDNLILVGSVLLGGSLFVNIILIVAICVSVFFIYHKKLRRPMSNVNSSETNMRFFTYQELVEATGGFKEELGKGAFGVVYKEAIEMGSSVPVAVKKLYSLVQDNEREFKTEVNVIGQTNHKNLVRLVGFCDEGLQRLLVYEFLSNGSLASFLFGDLKPSWKQRINIAVGIARGLLYLHDECSTQIIHCDIKPQNILLDNYYNARIADFGLAKLLMMDQSQTRTAIRGTKGYVAPEWFRNMPITAKVDVYSFGVMLLEIICCRRSVNVETIEEEKAILTDWAYDCYREGVLDPLVEHDVEVLNDREKLEKYVMVAIWCIQEDPSLRPTMRRVTQMLEGVVEVLVPPCPCPFSRTVTMS